MSDAIKQETVEAGEGSLQLLPMVAALLRVTIQSFDAGGESMRSLRSLAVETAWHMIHQDDARFERENRDCDNDQWAYVRRARLIERSPLTAAPAPAVGEPVALSPSIESVVKRLLNPQFGTETSERLLMGTAADAIRHLAKQEADIRAAYCVRRAENTELVRENKRLDREWADAEARALAAEADLEKMRRALEPFAEAAALYDPDEGDGESEAWSRAFTIGSLRRAREALSDARPQGHVEIAHDGFAGDIIGHYTTREGKDGVVVQQDGTRVVHVYGEKWLRLSDAEGKP